MAATTTTADEAPTPLRAPTGAQALLVLAVTLGAMLVLAALSLLVSATLLDGRAPVVLAVAAGTVGAWAALWLTLVRRLGWAWRDLGFVRGRQPPAHLLWQVPGALAASLLGAAALGGVLGLGPADGGAVERELLGGVGLSPGVAVLAVCIVLVLPAAEEVLFRRVLLDWALTRVRPWVAVLLTAAAFAVVHVAPPAMAYLVFVGAAAAVLRLWHGTLWAPLALHSANNALVFVVAVSSG